MAVIGENRGKILLWQVLATVPESKAGLVFFELVIKNGGLKTALIAFITLVNDALTFL